MEEQSTYQQARERVKKKKAFYQHLGVYIIVMGFLFALNMLTTPWVPWFLFPGLGWGVGLALHYFYLFGWPFSGAGSPEWEERQVEKEVKKLKRQSPSSPDPGEEERLELKPNEELKEASVEMQKPYDSEDLV